MSENKTTKATTTKPAPRRLEDFPDFVAARDRHQELQGKLHHVEQEREAIMATMAKPTRSGREVEMAAAALVAGRAPTSPTIEQADLEKRLADLTRERQVLRRAVDLQAETCKRIRADRSREICESILPEYRARVLAIAQAAAELSRAAQAEEQLRRELTDNDVAFTMIPVPWLAVGGLDDYESKICRWLREAVEHGYLSRNDPVVKNSAAITGHEEFLRPRPPHPTAEEIAAQDAERDQKRKEKRQHNRAVEKKHGLPAGYGLGGILGWKRSAGEPAPAAAEVE